MFAPVCIHLLQPGEAPLHLRKLSPNAISGRMGRHREARGRSRVCSYRVRDGQSQIDRRGRVSCVSSASIHLAHVSGRPRLRVAVPGFQFGRDSAFACQRCCPGCVLRSHRVQGAAGGVTTGQAQAAQGPANTSRQTTWQSVPLWRATIHLETEGRSPDAAPGRSAIIRDRRNLCCQ